MRIGALVPAGFFIGSALCAWLLRFAPAAVNVDRTQPLVVVTYWQHFGALMWLALALAIALASVGYVGTLLASIDLRGVVVLCALACAAALLFPVVFSSDVYAYAGYGDMALHGINPYAHARITQGDPLLDAMVWQWGNPPPMCVYGPAFVWIAKAIVAAFLPLGVAAPLWALRVLACLALIACAPLAYEAFAAFPRSTRLAAAAGIALNPIAIWSAAEGHNDTLALAIVLGGFALVARHRAFAGALIVALSALVKAPGAIAALFLIPRTWGAAAGLAIVAALAIPLEYGVRAHLAPQGHYAPQFSLQYVSLPLAVVVSILLTGAALYALRYLSVTPGARGTAAALAVTAAWIAIPNPYPWYALWLLPVAFLAWNTRAAWALIGLSLLTVLRYYPDATTANFSRPLGIAVVAAQLLLPLVLLSGQHMRYRRRPDRPENHTTGPDFAISRTP